jgi:hypothetical protein
LPAEFGNGAGVILESAGAEGDFIASVRNGLADVAHFQLRKLFQVVANGASDIKQNRRTLAGHEVPPFRDEALLGVTRGGVHILS